MNLRNGRLITRVNNDKFEMMITEESDCSLDGGYSFEVVSNEIELTKENAIQLIEELTIFITD